MFHYLSPVGWGLVVLVGVAAFFGGGLLLQERGRGGGPMFGGDAAAAPQAWEPSPLPSQRQLHGAGQPDRPEAMARAPAAPPGPVLLAAAPTPAVAEATPPAVPPSSGVAAPAPPAHAPPPPCDTRALDQVQARFDQLAAAQAELLQRVQEMQAGQSRWARQVQELASSRAPPRQPEVRRPPEAGQGEGPSWRGLAIWNLDGAPRVLVEVVGQTGVAEGKGPQQPEGFSAWDGPAALAGEGPAEEGSAEEGAGAEFLASEGDSLGSWTLLRIDPLRRELVLRHAQARKVLRFLLHEPWTLP